MHPKRENAAVLAAVDALDVIDVAYLMAITTVLPTHGLSWDAATQRNEEQGQAALKVVLGEPHPLVGWTCGDYRKVIEKVWETKRDDWEGWRWSQ